MTAALSVVGLTVRAAGRVVADRVSFDLQSNRVLIILGETGAGKSLLARAIVGDLPENVSAEGRVVISGVAVSSLSPAERESSWGRRVALLPQEPWRVLDPLMKALPQVSEVYELVGGSTRDDARRRAEQDLETLHLTTAAKRRPGQLSGGMAQRLAYAAAAAGGAPLLIVDEPTKGLDIARRDAVIELLRQRVERGALVVITHDVAVAEQLGHTSEAQLLVMRSGAVVAQGPASQILRAPADPYTEQLLAAAPSRWPQERGSVSVTGPPVLEGEGLALSRGGRELFRDRSFRIHPGEVVGLVGDSGSGKTSLGDLLLGLVPPLRGTVRRASGLPAHRFQKLYQDPPAAFASGVPLRVLLAEVMRLHHIPDSELPPLLLQTALSATVLDRAAADVSGGELQRVALVRAMLLRPAFLFADEPTSRLDPVTAREITVLLARMARSQGCALLLVSHDRHVVEAVCDRTVTLNS